MSSPRPAVNSEQEFQLSLADAMVSLADDADESDTSAPRQHIINTAMAKRNITSRKRSQNKKKRKRQRNNASGNRHFGSKRIAAPKVMSKQTQRLSQQSTESLAAMEHSSADEGEINSTPAIVQPVLSGSLSAFIKQCAEESVGLSTSRLPLEKNHAQQLDYMFEQPCMGKKKKSTFSQQPAMAPRINRKHTKAVTETQQHTTDPVPPLHQCVQEQYEQQEEKKEEELEDDNNNSNNNHNEQETLIPSSPMHVVLDRALFPPAQDWSSLLLNSPSGKPSLLSPQPPRRHRARKQLPADMRRALFQSPLPKTLAKASCANATVSIALAAPTQHALTVSSAPDKIQQHKGEADKDTKKAESGWFSGLFSWMCR